MKKNKKILLLSIIICLVCLVVVFSTIILPKIKKEPKVNIPTEPTPTQTKQTIYEDNKEEQESTNPSKIEFPKELKTQKLVVSFVGDCLIGNDLGKSGPGTANYMAKENGYEYFFSQVKEIFLEDDLTIIDCEGVLSDNALAPIEKEEDPGYWYIGPSDNALAFKYGGVEVASVANNHTGDYGRQGFEDTKNALESAGIIPGFDDEIIYYQKDNITFSILCCNCWSSYHASLIRDKIDEMKKNSDIVIIFPHGGEMCNYTPEEEKVSYYKSFIDAGADIVAGNHAHVLQPTEMYKGKPIFYCLGNFIYGGSTLPENNGAIYQVEVTFTKGELSGIDYKVIPCYLYTTPRNNFMPEIMEPGSDDYNRIIDFLYGFRESPMP